MQRRREVERVPDGERAVLAASREQRTVGGEGDGEDRAVGAAGALAALGDGRDRLSI